MTRVEVQRKIVGFRGLDHGWHFGEGTPPTDDMILMALTVNNNISHSGYVETDAFPGIDGEIQLTAYRDQTYLELTLELDGSVTFIHEINDEVVEYEEGLTLIQALEKLGVSGEQWDTSGLSTVNIMTHARTDLRASHLDPQAQTEEYRSLRVNASGTPVVVSVLISRDITPQIHGQYSGTSRQILYRILAGSSNLQAVQAIVATTT